jgi:hypothetical protein
VDGIAAMSHLFEDRQLLLAAAARIVEFNVGRIADP